MDFNVVSPETAQALQEAIAAHQDGGFRFGAGYTDLIPELKKKPEADLTVINLAGLNDASFTTVRKTDEGVRIGALVTVNRIKADRELQRQFPVLHRAAEEFASGQIREVATVGGNLCRASPAGDMSAALTALEARCEILSGGGRLRVIPINDFFTGVQKTDLKKDEVLRSLFIASNRERGKVYSDFIKVATRRSMEIALVSLAYHIRADEKDKIRHAGIAIGSVAPTIRFVGAACAYLVGRRFSSIGAPESEAFAAGVLKYASPISDMRASAWYRRETLYNISRGLFIST